MGRNRFWQMTLKDDIAKMKFNTSNTLLAIMLVLLMMMVEFTRSSMDDSKAKTITGIRGWSNCSTLTVPSFVNETWPSYGFGCTSIKVKYFQITLEQRHADKRPMYSDWGAQEVDVCNSPIVDYYLNGSSCYDYYCQQPRAGRDVILSHCMYCNNREDFSEFHEALANGSCRALSDLNWYQTSKHCSVERNPPSDIIRNGIPLFYERSGLFCYCHNHRWRQIGFKCDGYTLFWIPYKKYVEPFVVACSALLLLTLLLFGSCVPLVFTARRNYNSDGTLFPVVRFAVVCFASITNVLVVVPNLTAFVSTFGVLPDPVIFISDVIAASSYIFVFAAFYTYMLSWVQALYRANTLDKTASLPPLMKVAAVPVYVICILIGATDISSVIVRATVTSSNDPSRYINVIGLILTAISISITGAGMIIYGLRIYVVLRRASKISFAALKFTRLMCAISIVLFLLLIHILMLAIIRLTKAEDFFGFWFGYTRDTFDAVYIFVLCLLLNISTFNKREFWETYKCVICKRKTTSNDYILFGSRDEQL